MWRSGIVVVAAAAAVTAGCSPASPDRPPMVLVTPSANSSAAPSDTPLLPTATPPPSPVVVLQPGDSGVTVLALQQRLSELGYWLGTADGRYGTSTVHAVVAFQKASGLSRDGVAGPVTLAALDRAARLRPRSSTGRLIEVDLARQLLLVVADGHVRWVMDTSTGAVRGTTPVGRFKVFGQVDGYDVGSLGVLYRPKYFVGGVAVHGYPNVPPYPASHGCVRVTDAAMDWLWANAALPIGGLVWVY